MIVHSKLGAVVSRNSSVRGYFRAMAKRILITGGAGFIGSALSAYMQGRVK